MEARTLELGLSISDEQLWSIEYWVFWIFVTSIPVMLTQQLARARSELKAPFLGAVSRQLDKEIPL